MANLTTGAKRGFRAATVVALIGAASSFFAAGASGSVKIVAPVSVQAPARVPFAADAPSSTEEVAFYVDGQRRSVDDSPSWKIRGGSVGLPPGRHVLKVKAKDGNRVVVSARATYVESVAPASPSSPTPASNPTGKSKTKPVLAPAPASSAVPAPAPTPAPKPNRVNPDLLFDGAKISDFPYNQSAPGAVTEVPDPTGGSETAMKMTVANSDVAPITPTDNPRAQLVSPSVIKPGDEFWWHSRFFLPKDFPAKVPGWFLVEEGPYGLPYDGPPPVSISVDETLTWQRNDSYGYDIPWRAPFERGQWIDILMHVRFATDGFVEMWLNGQQQAFFGPGTTNPNHEAETQRLEMKTMDHSNDGGNNFVVLQNYREAGMFNSATVYHGPTELGTTRESVEG